ncbi:transposase [Pseudomonas sp. FP453]|jgi:transposase|uniref:IS110 family transposase n=1 Tax=Pseudomonas sp. FP453 TaxID=2954094 RepID=UPI00273244ED|nr:transposase [Pseudomonas sp. FP453]WLH89913.1 transposase [Pseudomonas sp. FP453]
MFAGIDVSKDDLEAQLDSQAEEMSCSNTAAGFSRLIRWLKSHHVSRVVLEATGGYERQVMKALQAADLEVVRINPSRARSFARALGLQAKTDPIDAKLLAHFAATIKPPKSQPTSPEQDDLRALVHQRENFVQQRSDDERRVKTASSDAVKNLLKSHIDYLAKVIASVDIQIRQSVENLNKKGFHNCARSKE